MAINDDETARALELMEQALELLDRAGHLRAAAMLDHAITALPQHLDGVRERRAQWLPPTDLPSSEEG